MAKKDNEEPETAPAPQPEAPPLIRSLRGSHKAASMIRTKEKTFKVGEPVTSGDLPKGDFDRMIDEGHIVVA